MHPADRSPAQRPRQERGQPRALPAPLQGADRRTRSRRWSASARSPTWSRAARCACRRRTSPSRRSASAAAATASSCCRATASTSPATAFRGPTAAAAAAAATTAATATREDDFVFSLSREEFMQIFFDDLELPHLARTELGRAERNKSVRAGYAKTGVPANLCGHPHAARSRSRAASRLPAALDARSATALEAAFALAVAVGHADAGGALARRARPRCERRRGSAAVPRRVDLRYRNRVLRPEPIARAVMFCLMDVSASMDEDKKDLAKRFFTLLYLFLTRKYQRGGPGVHPPHRRRRGSRRGHVLPRSALRRHRRATRRSSLPTRSARERYATRLERLRGAGVRRRRVRRRPRAQRALPAREAAAGDALLHLSRARAATRRSRIVDAVGRIRARRGGHATTSRCAARSQRERDLSGVPRAVQEGSRNDEHARSPHGADWDFELLERYDTAIAAVAGEFGLDTYPNQIEIITSEQMLDAYASSGLPVGYPHWSYGKEFIRNEQAYRRGMQGLAYEIVINSDPCIAYLMEENTMTTQALVIAHASLRPQLVLQGQPPVPPVDRRRRDPRLPGVRAPLRDGMRGAARQRGGRGGPRRLPRADGARRRPLSPARRR